MLYCIYIFTLLVVSHLGANPVLTIFKWNEESGAGVLISNVSKLGNNSLPSYGIVINVHGQR